MRVLQSDLFALTCTIFFSRVHEPIAYEHGVSGSLRLQGVTDRKAAAWTVGARDGGNVSLPDLGTDHPHAALQAVPRVQQLLPGGD